MVRSYWLGSAPPLRHPKPPQPVGEVFYGGPIIRRNIGQVLGVR